MSKDKRDCSAQSIWSHLAINLKCFVYWQSPLTDSASLQEEKNKTKQKPNLQTFFFTSIRFHSIPCISFCNFCSQLHRGSERPRIRSWLSQLCYHHASYIMCLFAYQFTDSFFVVVCYISRSRCIMVCDSMLCLWINMRPVTFCFHIQ